MEKKYSAPAVVKLLDIIELLAREPREMSINEIANQTAIPINSAYRICLELEQRGYLNKNASNGLYQLGMGFYRIGEAAGARMDFRKIALPIMEDMQKRCNETVHLCILREHHLIVLDQIESDNPIRIHVETGAALYPHASAFGKCLLAYQPASEIDGYIQRGLQGMTPNTIIDPALLRRELDDIRKLGLAYDREEYLDGVVCVGACVFGRDGSAAGAIGIMGPKYRFTGKRFADAEQIVRDAAAELSQRLGYSEKPAAVSV